ncbi:hypothetical protein Poli38472_000202 [Pythium oligandrum]|uniref:Mitochondrial cardiolipin hydrolase n=1 Tax=Pythium oligandrum TaxID=41045 RepID=A0A8K1CBN5_PYTOL|nr:hypothetical protein Poli38472_000202 [Pythium oligandrum]|eukprot:TMW60160.1 hypothetical protein Poli38472_000202 [Pythium oligandrum]
MGNCIGCEGAVDTKAHTGKAAKEDSFVEVMFFPDPRLPCKAAIANEPCTQKRCRFDHDLDTNLLKILRYLRSAKKTMDICVFTITSDEIAEEVLAAHKRGVRVRVITDDGQSKGVGSDIQKFVDAGIPVRDDNARTYMHHKFCVIDGRTLLNGSFNWSRQAIVGNAENLVVHANGPIVRHFKDYYEKLWKSYEANQWK